MPGKEPEARRDDLAVIGLAGSVSNRDLASSVTEEPFGWMPLQRAPSVLGKVDQDPARIRFGRAAGCPPVPGHPQQGFLQQILGVAPVTGQQVSGAQQRPRAGAHEFVEVRAESHRNAWQGDHASKTSSGGIRLPRPHRHQPRPERAAIIEHITVVKINAITVAANAVMNLAAASPWPGAGSHDGFELLTPADQRTTWLMITRWRDEDSWRAWVTRARVQEATIRQASAARCLAGPASAANCGPTSRCRPGPVRPRLGQSACPAACPRPVSHARKRAAATQISQICSVSPTQPQLSEGVPNRDTARVLPGHRPSLSVMSSIDVASARRRLGAA